MSDRERPFNRPESLIGKTVFAFLDWMEARIRTHSRVGATAFFDEAKFPWLDNLKSEWQAVRAEAEAVLPIRDRLPAFQDISNEVGYILKDDQWKVFILLGDGIRSERNAAPASGARRPRGGAKLLDTRGDRTPFLAAGRGADFRRRPGTRSP
jgi:hypothetical protein